MAIAKDSSLVSAFINRGVLYGMQGKHQAAIDDFSKVILLDPRKEEAYFNRANTLLKLGGRENNAFALADISEAIKINPNRAIFYSLRALIHCQAGRKILATRDERLTEKLGGRVTQNCD